MALEEITLVLSNLTAQTILAIPNIIGAVILLIIGLVLGKVFGRVVKEVLDRVKLDYYVSETEKPMLSLSDLFSLMTRWWIYLAFVTASVGVLGITELMLWTRQILNFIPNIVGASLILVVGYVLAEYIKGHLKRTNKLWAIVTAKILFFFVLYVAIALALPVLGVSAYLVNNVLLVIVASVGLGVAIALGLGLKEAVADISKRYVKKVRV